jgi:hypothetical protein
MAERALYPLATRHLTSVAAVSDLPSWMETNAAGCDALISVWWDYPPSY